MKIILTSVQEFNPNIGGIERVSVSIAEALALRGVDVVLVSCRKSSYQVEYHLSSRQLFLPSPEDYAECNVEEFVRIVNEECAQIIVNQNSHSYEFNQLCEEVVARTHVKLISVFHFCPDMRIKNHHNNIDFKYYTLGQNLLNSCYNISTTWPFTFISMHDQKKLFRQIYRISDKVVLLSEKYKYDFMKIGSLGDGEKIDAIPNMLSFDVTEKYPEKERRILFCARFTPQKRPYRALYIWEKLQDKLHDWSLDMVGDGPMLARCKELSKEMQLKRVHFYGFKEPAYYYKRSPIFLMTSNYEGWSLTLNEAMQFGCIPFVFNSFASVSDIIDNGVTGFLITPFDIDAFAETVLNFIKSGQHAQFADRAFVAANRYSKDKIVDRWINLFDAVANNE